MERTYHARILREFMDQLAQKHMNRGLNIRTYTERIEEYWFEIDDLLDFLEQAEIRRDHFMAGAHISKIDMIMDKMKKEVDRAIEET